MDEKNVAIQIHGFSAAGHVGYPEMVLSTGTSVPDAQATELCAAIVRGGVGCSLFDGSAYSHMAINRRVGEDDDALTGAIMAFLKATVA